MKILIAVISSHNEDIYKILNNTIRSTWGHNIDRFNGNVKIIYYYGKPCLDNNGTILLNDRLYCNHLETFQNIGYKTIDSFQFFIENYEFDYIIRTNESSYIYIERMLEYMVNKPTQKYASGTILYHEPFPFLAGSCYVLSRDVVELIVNNKQSWNHNYIDDVALGQFLIDFNIQIIDNNSKVDVFSMCNENIDSVQSVIKELEYNIWHFRCKCAVNRNNDILFMNTIHNLIYDVNMLVTGGLGFIGSNFCVNILNKVSKLIILDKLIYCSNINNISEIINSNKLVVIKEDITICNLDKIMSDYNINTVVHFAAQTHVDNSYNGFFEFISDNILATHILLESCKNNKIKKILMMSTDEIYGPSINIKIDENSPFNPTNPYAASKASAEMIINAYKISYNMPIIIMRCNNVYGPKQYIDKVIPKFIHQILNNQPVTIHGNGHKIRDFIHVYDLCYAIECLLEKGIIGEIYNISEDNPHSILDLAHLLHTKLNKDINIQYVQDRPFNDDRYYISSEKLKKLGWSPSVNWDHGLNTIIEWIKNNYNII